MTFEELTQLNALGESEGLEFKKTTGQRTRAVEALCGMLNGEGGSVLFGVDNAGRVLGQEVSDSTLRELHAELRKIRPMPFPDVERVPLSNSSREVIVVTVPGRTGLYTFDDRPYVRNGPTTVRMEKTRYEHLLLEQNHGSRRWELMPAEGWTLADLDSAEIRRTVEEAIRRERLEDPGTREPADLLRGLNLLNGDGRIVNAAAVLFARSECLVPRMIQCVLRMARFAGTGKDEFLDNRQEHGNAFDLLMRAQRFLRDHLPVASRFEDDKFERIDLPALPPVAVREALANALVHRDYSSGAGSVDVALYSDRLEITNIGGLHFGLTPEDLARPHKSLPWNPLIAQTFYRRGIIENWGRGTLNIRELIATANLPEPRFQTAADSFTVVFPRPAKTQDEAHDGAHDGAHDEAHERLSFVEQRILQACSKAPQSTPSLLAVLEYRSRTGNFKAALRRLLEIDALQMTLPDKPRSKSQKYRLTRKGSAVLNRHAIANQEKS